MPLTVGTAGHIDHGKTWLVRALTGKDTDRLPEEQRRGISIDLGYAPLELPDGRRLSLVDVPGHERFVRNMVAGATGIDLFLLVIDAAEGARPQTHEHLAILRLLGIERGVVAVTKADAVDEETLAIAVEEARELVPEAEVVAVSAKTGDGLEELRAALAAVADERTADEAPTRLYVDRVFTLRGVGTVVTGTLWSGTIGEGDELRVEPAGLDVRVRSVQVHDDPVERAEAGQRVAVALPGVERKELARGDALVAPRAYPVTYRLDVALAEPDGRAGRDHRPSRHRRRACAGRAARPLRAVAARAADRRCAGRSRRPPHAYHRRRRHGARPAAAPPTRSRAPGADRARRARRARPRAGARGVAPPPRRPGRARARRRLGVFARLARGAPCRRPRTPRLGRPAGPGDRPAGSALGGGGRAAARRRAARLAALPSRALLPGSRAPTSSSPSSPRPGRTP